MSILKFHYQRLDGAKPGKAREFVDAIRATNRFYRNDRSQILYKVGEHDYFAVADRDALQSILTETGIIELSGEIDDPAFLVMHIWLRSAAWRLPRCGGAKAAQFQVRR